MGPASRAAETTAPADNGISWTAAFRSAVVSPEEQTLFNPPQEFADQTVRQKLHLAGGGDRFRIQLTHRYGRTPLVVGAAAATTRHGTVSLTFGGAATVTLAPGGEATTDPVELRVDAGSDLVLDLHLPEKTGPATYSPMAMETAQVVAGNQVGAASLGDAEIVEGRFFVAGVDVSGSDVAAPVVAAFGDSWFEGVGSTVGANRRFVDHLNHRLEQGWVVNLGIAGNRLAEDGVGERGLARFDREVLSMPGVSHVLVHFGINDLGLPGMAGEPPPPAEVLIDGFTALADRAHAAGLKIVAATIGPFGGATYPGVSTPEGLAVRREVNDWIRSTDAFDGVFDVAAAVADPHSPDRIDPAFDGGDGMHLNDLGAEAMAAAVDLQDLTLDG